MFIDCLKTALSFSAISVPGSVPGGVYTDLHNAGVIGDILSGYNDVLTRWVSYDTWTYTGKFNGKNLFKKCILITHYIFISQLFNK